MLLKLNQIKKSYFTNSNIERKVLDNLELEVSDGEKIAITGPSGSGKTTLLNIIGTLDKPDSGNIILKEKEITELDKKQVLSLRNEQIGFIFQFYNLIPVLTAFENVELPLEIYTDLNANERRHVATIKLAQVGLTGAEQRYPAELSGGMKKRAGLARALALDPSVVFFDEPSAGLDPVSSRNLDELVRQLSETLGTTMIIVSHELDSIFGIGDRIAILDKAKKGMVALGHPRELLGRDDLPAVREFLTRGGDRTTPAP